MSKVRSLTLDDLDSETLSLLLSMGNELVNEVYEKNTEGIQIQRATPKCDSSKRENWIKAKYVDKAFVKPFKKLFVKIVVTKSGTYSLKVIKSDEEKNMSTINSDVIVLASPNELLHLTCAYGDISLITYALALNADRNLIIDQMDALTNESKEINQKHKNFGLTPLIKAVQSVSLIPHFYQDFFHMIKYSFNLKRDRYLQLNSCYQMVQR